MIAMVLRRLLTGVGTLFVVISLTFVLIRLLPGGPFDRERKLPPEVQHNIEVKYHLNDPIPTQYLYYMNNLLHGDLGPSFTFKSRNVSDILEEATGYSLKIGFMALLLGTFLGVVSGTIAGMSSNRMVDGLFSFMGVSSLSMPSFIFGGFLVLLFSLRLNVLPAATLETPAHYILPVTALSLVPFAYSFLLIRTAVKETKKQAFVLIKRSFGINEVMVSLNHVLRNSLIPLVSILGPVAAALVTGSFAIETIFAVPGLGKHFVNGVMNRDYPLVMGITILYSVLLILFNTVTDILYSYLDPRLRSPSKVES